MEFKVLTTISQLCLILWGKTSYTELHIERDNMSQFLNIIENMQFPNNLIVVLITTRIIQNI